jgi:hypothetical protein
MIAPTTLEPEERLAYNQEEAAALLGVSVTTLWKETKKGKVRRTTRGLYPRDELLRYLKADLIDDEFAAFKMKQLAGRKASAS